MCALLQNVACTHFILCDKYKGKSMRILFFICCFSTLLVYGSQEDYQKMQDMPEDVKKHNELFNVIPLQDAKTGAKISYYQRKESVSDEHAAKPMFSWNDLMHAFRIMRTPSSDRKF